MAEFYTWTAAPRLMLTFVLALLVFSQTLATVLSFCRYRRSAGQIFEALLEAAVLVQVLVCSLLHGQMMHAYGLGLIPPSGYGLLRILVLIAAALLAAIVMALTQKPWPLLTVAAASLTLPVLEPLTGNAFAYLYLAAILFWLIRGLRVSLLRYREIKTSLSALSVKNAIDALHTGIMFYEADGFILLSNTQMQQLMTRITGKIQRNGKHFCALLERKAATANCQIEQLEGQNICLLPDGSAWMFTRTELRVRKKRYIQLTASDITARWELTAVLRLQNEKLTRRQEELSAAIANLHILSHERETQKAKMRAHDMLGERLTLLLRVIRGEQALDPALLRSLSQNLVSELKAAQSLPAPQDALNHLRQMFDSVGVEIRIDGALPADAMKGQLAVEIIREGAANAVRHGYATQVSVQMRGAPNGFRLKITDNGLSLSDIITEGGGLSGIRQKVKPFSGTVNVSAHPAFVLEVKLPNRV